jgi:hypothetical protein
MSMNRSSLYSRALMAEDFVDGGSRQTSLYLYKVSAADVRAALCALAERTGWRWS